MNVAQANELYREGVAGEQGMSRSTQRSFLERAAEIYSSEIRKQERNTTPNHTVVILNKNLGMANFRLAEIQRPQDLTRILYLAEEALRALTNAWRWQQPVTREGDWGVRLQGHISSLFIMAFKSMEVTATTDKLPKYQMLDRSLVKVFEAKELHIFQVQYRLAKGNYFYQMGVKAMEGADFKRTQQFLEYARDELHALMMFCSENIFTNGRDAVLAEYLQYLEQVKSLEDDIAFLSVSCEAVRYRKQADALFDQCVNETEELDMEIIWDALDTYKASGLSCHEVDIENEAIALSRQGRVFDKIFKIRAKAHEYYRTAFDMAQCLFPRDMTKKDWYKECKEALERFQKDIVREEEELREKEKAPYLAKMTTVLTDLKAVHKLEDAYKLMKYVYSKHPPKCKFTYDEKLVTTSTAKKHLMTAITHYHPDKQVEYDMEWRILCEEITKCLTVRYEAFK